MFGLCCNSGKVGIPKLRDPPDTLKSLLERDDRQACDFRENIWKYNRAFAFTSLRASEDHSVNDSHCGPPVFRIQGELYHHSGGLLPDIDGQPKYAQLYFYDSHAALEHRCRLNESLNPDTLRSLEEMLVNHHQYVPIYRHAFEVLQHYDLNNDVSIRLRVAPGYHHHRGRYNLPTADEVAVILPGVDGGNSQYSQRDIVLQRRAGDLQIISDLQPAYVPLYYVLLFPYSKNGWHPALKLCTFDERMKVKRLTLNQYVAYRLQIRPKEYSTLL